jgi:hypothetical protein
MGPCRSNNYTEENLDAAIQAVKKGMPFKTAAKLLGAPRSTPQFRCSEKFSKTSRGPAPVLSEEEESTLVWCVVTALAAGNALLLFHNM